MEWVDGPTLRDVIADGPPDLARTLALGRDIAEGLAAAHGQGILHRDLKAENVLITPDGRPKILDFGLAKQLQDETRASLSRSGQVLGTCRAMSPEQARGFKVDARSDLFALGTLLYEVATAESPFRASGTAETLLKVCSFSPPPVHEINDAMSEELSSLIAHLHRKSPAQRPPSAAHVARLLGSMAFAQEVAQSQPESPYAVPYDGRETLQSAVPFLSATEYPDSRPIGEPTRRQENASGTYATLTSILVQPRKRLAIELTLLALVLLLGSTPGARDRFAQATLAPFGLELGEPLSVAGMSAREPPDVALDELRPAVPRLVVLPFESLGPQESAYLAAGITEEITRHLAALSGLGVVSRTSAVRYAKADKTVQEIGSELKVDYVLEGTVNSPPDAAGNQGVRITPRLVRARDDTLIWTQAFDRQPAGMLRLQSEIASGVVGRLDLALKQPDQAALAAASTTRPAAYFAYLRGLDYKSRPEYSEANMQRTAQMFERAVEEDPEFVEAQAELAQIHSHIFFNFDASEARRQKALAALRAARSLAPERLSVRLAAAYFAYRVEADYQQALATFSAAARQAPHNAWVLEGIGYVRRRQGRLEDAAGALMKAFELDRGNASLAFQIGSIYGSMRNYPAADRWFDEALILAPDLAAVVGARAFNLLNWRGCPEPLDATVPCSTAGARAMLESLSSRDHPRLYAAWLFLDLADAARATETQAAAIYQQAVQRMRDKGRLEKESYLRLSAFWREILLLERAGEAELARTEVDRLRRELEAALNLTPDTAPMIPPEEPSVPDYLELAHLGICYATLGRTGEAIAFGERAVELYASDLYAGPTAKEFLALISLRSGLAERAIDLVEDLLSSTYKLPITRTELALDPLWEPLWEKPRFLELIASGSAPGRKRQSRASGEVDLSNA